MSDPWQEPEPADEPPQPEPEPAAEPEASNVNGTVLDVPTVNAHVVGVVISEGGGDPQTAEEPAEG